MSDRKNAVKVQVGRQNLRGDDWVLTLDLIHDDDTVETLKFDVPAGDGDKIGKMALGVRMPLPITLNRNGRK